MLEGVSAVVLLIANDAKRRGRSLDLVFVIVELNEVNLCALKPCDRVVSSPYTTLVHIAYVRALLHWFDSYDREVNPCTFTTHLEGGWYIERQTR